MEKIANKKSCEIASKWTKSLVNHMYWSAASTESGDGDIIEAKWLSVINHIHNKHSHSNKLFPKCVHSTIRNKKWIQPRKFT